MGHGSFNIIQIYKVLNSPSFEFNSSRFQEFKVYNKKMKEFNYLKARLPFPKLKVSRVFNNFHCMDISVDLGIPNF